MLSEWKDINYVLAKLVRDCISPDSDVCAVLELDNDEDEATRTAKATLSFVQKTDFRTDPLLVLDLKESKPETIKQSISYRISRTKELNTLVKNRIEQICTIVEGRNPTLMDEIRKGSRFTDDFAALSDEQIRIDTSLWAEK